MTATRQVLRRRVQEIKRAAMPEVPEEMDVFRLPHVHMKKLVHEMEKELLCTNFSDSGELHSLLDHLSTHFQQFKCHEDIENQHIMTQLVQRLPHNAKTTLANDIHSDNRLSDLVSLVSNGQRLERHSEMERVCYGETLKTAITNFTLDFIPHMNEEEEVFLPLLVEYFSEGELRQMTQRIIELHQLKDCQDKNDFAQELNSDPLDKDPSPPSLLTLPPELLLRVLSYLSPSELFGLSHLHSTLHTLTFDGSLWTHLHPVRWAHAAHGGKSFYPPMDMECEMSQDVVVENDVMKQLLSVEGRVNANMAVSEENEDAIMDKEMKMLCGIIDHLLPKVGSHVHTLDLAYGKAVSNEVVFRMLRLCPNLHYLDLSHTVVSDFAFRGLIGKGHHHWKLKYIDLSGCSLITDIALQRISQGLTAVPFKPSLCACANNASSKYRAETGSGWSRDGRGLDKVPQLKCLILSGCFHITDIGLRSLAVGGGLPNLHYLDLSGLPNITQDGLQDLVSASPCLQPELLFYCDNILAGPYAECANGCQNVGSPDRVCCRQVV